MNLKLDAVFIAATIERLRASHPGLFDDEDAALLTVASETEATEFLSRAVKLIHDTDDVTMGTNARIQELRDRRERLEHRSDALRGLVMKVIEATGLKSIPLPMATVGLRTNPPKVVIADETAIPDEFCRFKREPDRAAIASRLKAGELVAGAVLSNQEQSLSIRVK